MSMQSKLQEQNNILCVIPARGGSKRIPNKNTKLLAGKSLVSYTIEAAIGANVFSRIVVSSDDPVVLSIAANLGVKTDKRSNHLAGDHVRAVKVVEEFLLRKENKDAFEYVAMLLPTCPFRSAEDVSNAVNNLKNNRHYDFSIGVTKYDFPPQLAMNFDDDGKTLVMREPAVYEFSTRSQALKEYFHPNGAVYVAKTKSFLEKQTFFSEQMMAYVMPIERSYDIDYPFQFRVAEVIAEELLDK